MGCSSAHQVNQSCWLIFTFLKQIRWLKYPCRHCPHADEDCMFVLLYPLYLYLLGWVAFPFAGWLNRRSFLKRMPPDRCSACCIAAGPIRPHPRRHEFGGWKITFLLSSSLLSNKHDWCILWVYSLLRVSLIGLCFPWISFSFVSPLETKGNQRKTIESTQSQTKGNHIYIIYIRRTDFS